MNNVFSSRPSSIRRILTVEEVIADIDVVIGSPGTMDRLGAHAIGEIGALCVALDDLGHRLPNTALSLLESMYNRTFHHDELAVA